MFAVRFGASGVDRILECRVFVQNLRSLIWRLGCAAFSAEALGDGVGMSAVEDWGQFDCETWELNREICEAALTG